MNQRVESDSISIASCVTATPNILYSASKISYYLELEHGRKDRPMCGISVHQSTEGNLIRYSGLVDVLTPPYLPCYFFSAHVCRLEQVL